MKNTHKIYLFLSFTLLSFLAYLLIFFSQLGSSIKAEWWIHDVKIKKEQIASHVNKNRIVIVSGSNGLFGFNSQELSTLTGHNVVNLAMHASLDLSYYRMLIDKNIKKGDIVIMPLEYGYYSRGNEYSDWFVSNMKSWGMDYLNWLPLTKKIEFISKVDWKSVITGALTPDRSVLAEKNIILKDKGNVKGYYYGYSYKTLTPLGDINRTPYHTSYISDMISNPDKYESILSYGKSDPLISDYTIEELEKIKKITSSRGATLFITWPATMKTKFFNEHDPDSLSFTVSLKKQLSNNGFDVICNNFYANINPTHFLDTHYHLDSVGAKIRTESLFKCLKSFGVLR